MSFTSADFCPACVPHQPDQEPWVPPRRLWNVRMNTFLNNGNQPELCVKPKSGLNHKAYSYRKRTWKLRARTLDPFRPWKAARVLAIISHLSVGLFVLLSLHWASFTLQATGWSMAAYERRSVTLTDATVLQIQFGVSSPESLIGLRWVVGLSHAVSGGWEDAVMTRHPLEWAWCMLVPREREVFSAGQIAPSLPGLAQRICNLVIMYKVLVEVLESSLLSLTP